LAPSARSARRPGRRSTRRWPSEWSRGRRKWRRLVRIAILVKQILFMECGGSNLFYVNNAKDLCGTVFNRVIKPFYRKM
jgi:hypothetical protein